jgi:uncharacterized protein YjbK
MTSLIFEQTTLTVQNIYNERSVNLNISTEASKTNHYFIDVNIYDSNKKHYRLRVLKTEYDKKFLKNI